MSTCTPGNDSPDPLTALLRNAINRTDDDAVRKWLTKLLRDEGDVNEKGDQRMKPAR